MSRKDSDKCSNDMKKIVLTIWLLVSAATAFAQGGLMINQAFQGGISGKDKTETRISGKRLKPYKLSLYRHCKAHVSEADLERMTGWILKDAEPASDKETEYQDGKLVYALIRREDPEVGNKYICFQVKSKNILDNTYGVTLVYLEGKATLEDLEEIFKK